MRPPRFTIAGLMFAVVMAAVLLAVLRASSITLVALIPFGITALVARLGSSPPAFRRALCAGAVGTLLLPSLAAIWINHEMWGYYVSRPAVDRRIVEARQIEAVSRVETKADARGKRTFSGAPFGKVDDYIQVHPQEDDHYVLEGRVLRELKYRQVLSAEFREIPAAQLVDLHQILDDTGRLEDGEPGYTDAKKLSGIVVEALGRDGRPLLFVGTRGGQVSNDHYPYYEFLFTSDSHGGPLKLLSFKRFYYDVAGVEGVEWPAFLPIFSFFGLVPTLPLQGFLLLRGRRR
jgi:hypothetical protein